ncbi:hypothetical protein Nepgr_005311 [Nepenthes gracilis]|uniref:Uncharacterized protein n=1 Tax=Nepenthes gracilis TaxID=150966 RepID=A0AAD3S2Y9_NEPGR|nr:hypothetical protein Nepgr_005311 [Nepenthes gracilis]
MDRGAPAGASTNATSSKKLLKIWPEQPKISLEQQQSVPQLPESKRCANSSTTTKYSTASSNPELQQGTRCQQLHQGFATSATANTSFTALLHLASNTAASATIIKPANGILNAKSMIFCYGIQPQNWAQQQDQMSLASIGYDPPSAQASHERL